MNDISTYHVAYSDILVFSTGSGSSTYISHGAVPEMTANHVLLNDDIGSSGDVPWATYNGYFTIGDSNGNSGSIPANTILYFGVPIS